MPSLRRLAACAVPALAATAALGDGGPPGVPPPPSDVARGVLQDGEDAATLFDTEPDPTLAALERGLAWLAAQQDRMEDGSFPKTGHPNEKYAPIGVAALATLAFLSAGNGVDRGPHGRNVALGVDYLLSHVDLDPASRHRGYIARQGDVVSRIHGHGFATLALAEAWSVSPRTERGARMAVALRAAVERIEQAQSRLPSDPGAGGWWYEPEDQGQHEGSTTICLVQALRAAHGCGVRVDPEVVQRAERYVLLLQQDDPSGANYGSFAYQLHDDRYSLALTAAGIATLNAAGRYEGAPIDAAITAIRRGLLDREAGLSDPPIFPFYERLYLAQAFWQMPDLELFQDWAASERERVLGEQRADGSWYGPEYGDCYATAVNCLFLALPQGLLPIFQR